MTLDPVVTSFIGGCFLCFLTGYGIGILWRFIRQIFERASRT